MRGSSSMRRGLTLVELLVILLLIGIFIVIFVPHGTDMREAARRTQCINNLKQIGLALHSYAANWGGLPASSSPDPVATAPGYVSARFDPAPHVALLTYLERENEYNALNWQQPMADLLDLNQANSTVARASLFVFACPSDAMIKPDADFQPNSYRANLGPCAVCPDSGRGALRPGVVTPIESFTDGTSQTLAFAEKLVGSLEQYDPKRDWIDTHATAPLSADAWVTQCAGKLDPRRANYNLGRTWLIAGGMQTHFFTALPPNAAVPDCGSSTLELGYGAFTARSPHPTGVNGLLADGSVRFFKETITPQLWRSLGTRAAGEPLIDHAY